MDTVSARYHMMDWQEVTLAEQPNGSKLTHVDAVFRYEGRIDGEAKTHFLMVYEPAGTGVYEGYESFTGTFDGRPSATWLRHSGSFDADAVKATVTSIAGSGTGSLAGTILKYHVVFGGEGPFPLMIDASSETAT